ncbi:MAG: 2-amino-4-hydroxy-6-hydroxymethyldihydropteridine diphosphokinase [Clostridia bacterium]
MLDESREQGYPSYLSLGSNKGDREQNISQAILQIAALDQVELIAQSSIYETTPVGFVQQPDFLNCVVKILTTLDPLELLDKLQGIEQQFGRKRLEYWGSRTLDIDILLCGDKIIREPRLKVPHPLMFERGFVLLPLAEIMTEEERIRYGIESTEGEKWHDAGVHPFAKT